MTLVVSIFILICSNFKRTSLLFTSSKDSSKMLKSKCCFHSDFCRSNVIFCLKFPSSLAYYDILFQFLCENVGIDDDKNVFSAKRNVCEKHFEANLQAFYANAKSFEKRRKYVSSFNFRTCLFCFARRKCLIFWSSMAKRQCIHARTCW